MKKTNKKLTWTVKFSVDESWIADGFEMTDEMALDMLSEKLGFAYENELAAKVIKAPSQDRIARIQGYEVKSLNGNTGDRA